MKEIVESLFPYIPYVKEPDFPPDALDRLKWTFLGLLVFFVFYNTPAIGTRLSTQRGFDFLQMIVASRWGTLMTLGIGPIVFASLLMFVLKGMDILPYDPSDPLQRPKYLALQKILAVLMAFIQGLQFAFSPFISVVSDTPEVRMLVGLQFALASIFLIFIDEVITKYGLGSGIGLFIAAGISYSIFRGAVGLFFGPGGVLDIVGEGGATVLAEVLKTLFPLISTLVIFLTVAYVEGIRVRIPLVLPGYGAGQRFQEFPLLYVSNIPVIFAAGVLFYIRLLGMGLAGLDLPGVEFLAVADQGRLVDGFLYLLTPLYIGRGLFANYEYIFVGRTPFWGIPEWVHALTYVAFLTLTSAWIGLLWIEGTGTGPSDLAEQMARVGIGIRGLRISRKIIERKLQEYIPTITILGSAFVGFLAGVADLTGALGTGTGVLLTVGILYRMYLQAKQLGVVEAVLRRLSF